MNLLIGQLAQMRHVSYHIRVLPLLALHKEARSRLVLRKGIVVCKTPTALPVPFIRESVTYPNLQFKINPNHVLRKTLNEKIC